MMIILLSLVIWVLLLAVLAGLCGAARRGDLQGHGEVSRRAPRCAGAPRERKRAGSGRRVASGGIGGDRLAA